MFSVFYVYIHLSKAVEIEKNKIKFTLLFALDPNQKTLLLGCFLDLLPILSSISRVLWVKPLVIYDITLLLEIGLSTCSVERSFFPAR